MEPYNIKQVIIVRRDINMNMGKTAAQVAHASMAFLTKRIEIDNDKSMRSFLVPLLPVFQEWLNESFAKIVLWVQTVEELHKLHEQALEADIEANFITDSGHTYFKGVPTVTCLALGPDYSDKLDPITRHLPLL